MLFFHMQELVTMLLLSVIRFVAPNQESIVYHNAQIGVASPTATGPAG